MVSLYFLKNTAIPFSFKVVDSPGVHILGGERRRGIVSVEIGICYEIPDDEAVSKLQANGFSEGMELILG